MTIETKWIISPEDILAIRFECGQCHASNSIPIRRGLAEFASLQANAQCKVCLAPWNIALNSAEHKALTQFSTALETIALSMAGRNLLLKLEVRGNP